MNFSEKTGKKGYMISAVDLLKGIAAGAGMGNAQVPGANGGLHTNYEGKVDAAIDALLHQDYDFAYVHIEAPDEMGHQGSVEKKVLAIEYLDQKVIEPIYNRLKEAGEDFRLLILPDHPTPIAKRTHTSEPVPFLLYDSRDLKTSNFDYSEKDAEKSGFVIDKGHELIDFLFEN